MNPVMSKFVLGETSFVSKGVCTLKIDGEKIDIPIKSVGVIEAQQVIEDKKPVPPSKLEVIEKDSEPGKALKLKEDTAVRVIDYTSEKYLSDLADYGERMQWASIVAGIDMEFSDVEGNPVTDKDQIIQGLKNAGITGHHLDKLAKDIRDLTMDSEKSADFLSGNVSV